MLVRPRRLQKWLAPVCLPMLLGIQPFPYYTIRTLCVLAVLFFMVWLRRGNSFHYAKKKARSWYHGVENVCRKCEAAQLEATAGCRLAVGWGARSVRRLPWRIISRHWGKLADATPPFQWMAVLAVWIYARLFSCNLAEAERDRLRDYATLGDFFRRRLKPEARPICQFSPVVSPADGTVTSKGQFRGGFLEQVKGVHYSLNYFLGLKSGSGRTAANSDEGENSGGVVHAAASTDEDLKLSGRPGTALFQWVVYLGPGDYHRFHSPVNWTVRKRKHFHGELLSVRPAVASSLPGLFHVNERVAWFGEWEHGFFSMTAVGATNVGSIKADFDPDLRTNRPVGLKKELTMASTCSRRNFHYSERTYNGGDGVRMAKGQDFGHFEFGSTVVLVFEAPEDSDFSGCGGTMTRVRVGEGIMP